MGQPKEAVLKTWSDFDRYRPPDPYDPARFDPMRKMRAELGDDKYYKANFVLTGFTMMCFLRGFSETLEDMYLERENIERLADVVFSFEEEVIKQLKPQGFDAVAFADDWGNQQSMFISPKLWRDIFKPRYKRQIDLTHECGLDLYFHSCGYIYDIMPDFVEIGLDILNPGQPNINGIPRMGENFSGKSASPAPSATRPPASREPRSKSTAKPRNWSIVSAITTAGSSASSPTTSSASAPSRKTSNTCATPFASPTRNKSGDLATQIHRERPPSLTRTIDAFATASRPSLQTCKYSSNPVSRLAHTNRCFMSSTATVRSEDDLRSLTTAKKKSIIRRFSERVDAAAERVRRARRGSARPCRGGGAALPVPVSALTLDLILRYGDALADLFCQYPDDIALTQAYDTLVGHQPADRADRINLVEVMTHRRRWTDEWGTGWGHADGGVGASPLSHPLRDWSQLDDYLAHRIPDPRALAASTARCRP